jgi:hypothetical protein
MALARLDAAAATSGSVVHPPDSPAVRKVSNDSLRLRDGCADTRSRIAPELDYPARFRDAFGAARHLISEEARVRAGGRIADSIDGRDSAIRPVFLPVDPFESGLRNRCLIICGNARGDRRNRTRKERRCTARFDRGSLRRGSRTGRFKWSRLRTSPRRRSVRSATRACGQQCDEKRRHKRRPQANPTHARIMPALRLSHESNRGHRRPNMWDVDAQRLQHVAVPRRRIRFVRHPPLGRLCERPTPPRTTAATASAFRSPQPTDVNAHGAER